jgi:ESF2/ABP1 family protein
MRPTKVRSLLSLQGEVLRIYFTPEDQSVARRRKKAGGNTGKQFTDGWVEFADKKVAKRVAAALNSQPMGMI